MKVGQRVRIIASNAETLRKPHLDDYVGMTGTVSVYSMRAMYRNGENGKVVITPDQPVPGFDFENYAPFVWDLDKVEPW